MAPLLRPIGLFKGGLKVLSWLQIVKTFLLPRLTCGFPLYHAKKVKKIDYERTDRLLVDRTFEKGSFFQPGLQLLTLEPTCCIQARIRAKLQLDLAPEIIRELIIAGFLERQKSRIHRRRILTWLMAVRTAKWRPDSITSRDALEMGLKGFKQLDIDGQALVAAFLLNRFPGV